MSYCFNSSTNMSFAETMSAVKQLLADEGFGMLSEIDVRAKMKEKLGVDFRNYTILGACNPFYAFRALTTEPNIGTMLPCSVIVQEDNNGQTAVAAIDPVASMQAVDNHELMQTATIIGDKLKKVISSL